ncbi:hypothetical protein [Micromonospora thermarum]|uniref:Uncharacterized protein n=1 Tax=Micromonospora thermarum TaxID=2720024 RepID=A0ABX0Z952_9ACTN|nr:hypothetical protein [Micromonospora thermarum]NJP32543.1 hypothetical protein [Micromonospora thermarum]
MKEATAALKLDPDKYRFPEPKFPDDDAPSSPTASAQPERTAAEPTPTTARPTPTATRPTCDPERCATASPTGGPKPTRTPSGPPKPSPSLTLEPSRTRAPG